VSTEPRTARGESHLNCPRCGLTIVPRVPSLAIRHCPRCLARDRTAVELFSSQLPAEVLYAEGLLPRPRGRKVASNDLPDRRARRLTTEPVEVSGPPKPNGSR
jgi:hypothetical protein